MNQFSYSRNTEEYSFIYETIGSRIRHWSQTQPNKTAIAVHMDQERRAVLTFGELYDKAVKLAKYYLSLGVKPGNRVAVFVYNSPEWLVASVACSLAGAVAVNSFTFADEKNVDIVYTLGCKVIVADLRGAQFKAVFCKSIEDLRKAECLVHVIVIEDSHFTLGEMSGEIDIEQALSNEMTTDIKLPDVTDAEELTAIFQTAGTTGSPRFVPHSHLTLINNFHLLYGEMGLTNNDVFFSDRPMSFMPGYPMPIVVLGCTFVTRHNFFDSVVGDSARSVCRIIENESVTCGFFPPYLMCGFSKMRLSRFSPEQIPPLMSLITYCQPLPKTDLRRFLEYSLTPCVGYGSAEMGWVTLCSVENLPEVDDDVIATPLPSTEMKIVDEFNRIVPVNKVGEICVRNVSSVGKYLTSDGKFVTFTDDNGWFHTGDLGCMLSDGNFCIKGRTAEMIVRSNVKISPAAIEHLLSKHPAIAEAVVVGITDEILCQEVCACVILKPEKQLTASQLEAYSKQRLEPKFMPRHFLFFDKFPRLSCQKINRQSVAKMAQEQS